jgi:uncharacterized tellurite resistance protein B-like protein
MALNKSEQLARLKSIVRSKGGHSVFSTAKSAMEARESKAPLATNGDDDERAGRHALATFDAAFLMAAVDGVVSNEEIEELAEVLSALTDGATTDEDLGYLLENFGIALEQEGLDERLANIAEALDTEPSRRLAFVTACGIAYLDEQITEEEEALFAKLARALRIPEDEANALLDEIERALGVAH